MKVFTQKLLQNSKCSLVTLRSSIVIISLLMIQNINAQSSIVGVTTDFQGFTESTTATVNASPRMDRLNNLLAFTVGATTYSTGVNDAVLTTNTVTFTAGNYGALVPSVAEAARAGQGDFDDGVTDSFTTGAQIYPTPGTGANRDVRAYLTDGINGLGFSTFANNVGGTFIFNLTNIDASTVGDGIPDLVYFNMAAPSASNIVFEIYNGATLLGTVASQENSHANVARVKNDRFLTETGASSGAGAVGANQFVQGFSVDLSDLGISQAQMATATELRLILPNQADPPFIAYNLDAFTAIDPSACTIASANLKAITCNDNGTGITTDDFITFDLNPRGNNIGATYTVSVTSGSITPTSAAYGVATTFTLQNGSVGAGNVTVTLADIDDSISCAISIIITDPGACSDTDGDGVLDFVEQGGPNGGDSNGDGTPDYLQPTVVTLESLNGSYVTVETSGLCQQILTIENIDESSIVSDDADYSYPLGLFDFTLNCVSPGDSATVTYTWHGLSSTADYVYRKYGPTVPGGATSQYQDFTVIPGTANINGVNVPTISYSITDGAFGDDTVTDGQIVDPSGLALLNNTCVMAEVLCTPNAAFPAETAASDLGPVPTCGTAGAPPGFPVSPTLFATPNPAFYTLQVVESGDLYLFVNTSPAVDVDFALWGPFASPDVVANCAGGNFPPGVPIDCDYSVDPSEQIDVPGVLAGEVYILMINNFSGAATDITLSPDNNHGTNTATLGGPLSFSAAQTNTFIVSDAPQNLQISPPATDPNVAGVTFSGTGITDTANGTFDPSVAGVGTYTITVTGTSYLCPVVGTIDVTVTDGDGVPDAIEDAAPNGGDANGDGTLDSQQSNVASIVDATGLAYATLEVTGNCSQIINMQAFLEADLATLDDDFDFPVGLIDFTLQCGAPGESAVVKFYWHGLFDVEFYRKYGPLAAGGATDVYRDLAITEGAELVGGVTVPTTTYVLVDGLTGDDTVQDGEITDPSGPATVTSDSDGDGILDVADLDSDNDGILDEDEGCGLFAFATIPTNNAVGTLNAVTVTVNSADNDITAPGGAITFEDAFFGPDGTFAANEVPIIGGDDDITLTFSQPVSQLRLNIRQLSSNTLTFDQTFILLSSDGDFTVTSNTLTGLSQVGSDANGTLLFQGPLTTLSWTSNNAFPGDGFFLAIYDCNVDTDGDGFGNYVDIDSDNDGIPDVVEAQATGGAAGGTYIQLPNSGVVGTSVQTAVGVEGIPNGFGTGFTPEDTDGDGTPDYLDTDTDNDGIDDTVEAGFTTATNTIDTDLDGLLDQYDASPADPVDGPYDVDDDQNTGSIGLQNTFNPGTVQVDYREKPAPGCVDTNLNLWVKADAESYADGAAVTSWTDQTANGGTMTPPTVGQAPDFESSETDANFNPYLDFNDVSNDRLNGANYGLTDISTTQYQIFFVYNQEVTNGSLGSNIFPDLWDFDGAIPNERLEVFNDVFAAGGVNVPAPRGQWHIGVAIGTAAVPVGITSGRVDGLAGITTGLYENIAVPGFQGNGNVSIGTVGQLDADIAEIIYYAVPNTGTDLQKVESYLAIKYGITLDQTIATNYLDGQGSTIWDATVNAAYNNDIFGIGRDDCQSLSQPKSKSVNTDAIVTVANTDLTTPAAFGTDKQFFTLGNNGAGAAWTTTGAPGLFRVLSREWQVQDTNAVGAVALEFDVDDADFDVPVLVTGTTYYIVYDTNGDTNLSDETPIALTNSSGSLWETAAAIDMASGTRFTIATMDIDTDMDGVSDVVDLDNDNDGILDEDEGCGQFVFSALNATTATASLNANTLTLTSNDGTLTLPGGPITFEDAFFGPDGTFPANEVPILQSADDITMTFTQPVSQVRLNIRQLAGNGLTFNEPFVLLSSDGDFTISGNTLTGLAQAGSDANGTLLFQGPLTTLSWTSNDAAGLGDGFFITIYDCNVDTDGDGIGNYLDLDSDNDGIYDVVESGGTPSTATGQEGRADDDDNNVDNTGSAGGPGIPTSAGTGTNPTDTLADGSLDYLTLDSDGDLCNDTLEAGFTDGDDNGLLGTGTFGAGLTIDANGVVTSGTDGYTDPADADTNGTDDYQQVGTAPTVVTDPTDQLIGAGGTANFTAGGSASLIVYQWQQSINGGATFLPLTDGVNGDGVTVSGATGATLTLADVPATYDGYLYQVIISDLTYVCTTVTSANALLTIGNDADGDTIPDTVDLDDDNDGIPDLVEANGNDPDGDADGDGIPNYQDTTDGGGVGDGSTTEYTDSNLDGIPDVYDTDSDGVANHLDLDSDNDGVYDIVESGQLGTGGAPQAADADFNGRIDGGATNFGANGLYNGIENNDLNTATLLAANADSDSDGIIDAQELDSDNDLCNDANEAYANAGQDGGDTGVIGDDGTIILDPITGIVTNNGADYTITIADADSNGELDFQEEIPFIANQPINFSALNGGAATFGVTITGPAPLNLQWEESTDGGATWNPISNGGIYSGATTQTLLISPVDASLDLNLYRIAVTTVNYVCLARTSNSAALLIDADSDGDTVNDSFDLDDDNDGLLDTEECDLGGGSFGTIIPDDADLSFDITPNTNANDLANFLFQENSNITLVSAVLSQGDNSVAQVGTFDDGDQITDNGGAPNAFVDFSTGIIFSTGDVTNLGTSNTLFEDEVGPPFTTVGPALGQGAPGFGGNGTDSDFAGLTPEFDVASLEIVINVPSATIVTGEFVFASEEYNDFVNQGVNDAAKVFVNGDNVALTPGGATLSIDAINNGAEAAFYVDNESNPNAVNIEADGFTTTLRFAAALNAGNNIIKIGIADNGDRFFDSWLLFKGNSFVVCFDRDTDGDGIVDRLDLDSDNDGIYDATEAGHNQPFDTEGRIQNSATASGPNGYFDAVETPAESGTPNYTPLDADSDGILDAYEIDSDNDTCFDTVEAGFTDDDGNGFLGDGVPSPIAPQAQLTIDGNGVVTSGTDGYTVPVNDEDTSLVPDYREPGTLPVIATSPIDALIIEGNNATFDVALSLPLPLVEVYRWEESTDNGATWAALTNTAPYSGVDTSQLTITGVTAVLDENLYRVIVTDGTFLCGEVTSAEARLLVDIDTDGDTIADSIDIDDDNDGIPDLTDALTIDPVAPCFQLAPSVQGLVLESGVAGEIGAVYRASNVLPPTFPVAVDLLFAINDKTANAVLVNVDDDATRPTNWQPIIENILPTAGTTESIQFQLSFVLSGTNTVFTVPRYGGIVLDVDGGPGDEIIEIASSNAFATNSPTNVNTFNVGGGIERFTSNGASFVDGSEDPQGIFYLGYTTGATLDIRVGTQTAGNKNFFFELGECAVLKLTTPLLEIPNGPDADGDGVPNHLDLDSDNDGIADVQEAGLINGTTLTDADNDGIIDGASNATVGANGLFDDAETGPDSNTTNYITANSDLVDANFDFVDLDSDQDGIPDNVEAQSTAGYIAPNGVSDTNGFDTAYGGLGIAPENTDGPADTVPDYLDTDSDQDGVLDAVEGFDTDADGVPNIIASGADSDFDGLDDAFDGTPATGYGDPNGNQVTTNPAGELPDTDGDATTAPLLDVDYRDTDDDNDGILTTDENPDPDGDPLTNDALDSDNDGMPDYLDADDYDGDGTPDTVDLDDDNDGIPDLVELAGNDPFLDEDGDGILNYLDTTDDGVGDGSTTDYTDVNLDGIPDVYDADGDGVPNHLDKDSDNDGIPDVIEAGGIDTDGDGEVDYPTPGDPTSMVDVDNDGLDDSLDNIGGTVTTGTPLPIPNSDASAIDGPDYLDIDADDDGIPDNIEAQSTAGYNPPLGTDSDNDGIDDQYDSDQPGSTPLNVPENTDGTDNPDYRDTDTDNDGINDIIENGDTDNVASGTDTDGDGLDDAFDDNDDSAIPGSTVNDGINPPNAANLGDADGDGEVNYRDIEDNDNDGIADSIDIDDDNDGIPDTVEQGTGGDPLADTDGNGILDYLQVTPANDLNNDGVVDVFDADGDGIIDQFDLDGDNDGIPDLTEAGGTDTDGDGVVDTQLDSDDDGIPDSVDVNQTGGIDIDLDGIDDTADIDFTGGTDTDGDGIDDTADPDADGDGQDDVIGTTPLPTPNTDGTGNPNFLDIDADDDGIVDNIEAQPTTAYVAPLGTDADNDGIDDAYDSDIPGATLLNFPENTDATLLNPDLDPDYIDLDADGDGENDTIEAYDTDDDGVADTVPVNADVDDDGLDDAFDTDTASPDPTNGGQTAGNPFPDTDSPGGEPDWRDQINNDLEITKVDSYVDTNANGIIDAGDTITYEFAIFNNGNVTLTNVNIIDNAAGVALAGAIIPALPPATVSAFNFTGTYTITAADITTQSFTNTATVSAEDPNGNTITSLSDDPDDPADATDDDGDGNPDDPTITDLRQPLLDVTKTDTYVDTNTNGIIDAGDTINYVFNVTNRGTVDLTGISVTDALVTVTGVTPTIDLVVGANDNTNFTASYVITPADITAGSFTNTAVATAPNPLGGPDISDDSDDPDNPTDVDPDNDGSPDDPTVTDLGQPLLDITKQDTYVDTNANGIIDTGDTINYVFVVTNIGNVDLVGISVVDALATVVGVTPTINLAVGAFDNTNFTASYVITAADVTAGSFTNQAVVAAPNPLDPFGPPITDISDDPDDLTDVDGDPLDPTDDDGSPDDVTTTDLRQPLLDITKQDTYVDTNANGIIDAGDTINYAFNVTNTGNVDLTGISVTDALVTVIPATTIDLVAGANDATTYTASYVITPADITAGAFSNTAVADAVNPLGGPNVTDDSDDPDNTTDIDPDNDGSPDDPTVTDLRQPLLDITKTDTYVDTNVNGIIDAGDTINYVFVVTNTGTVDLTGISVTDALVAVTPATTIDLIVGAVDNSTYTASYIITAADVTAGSFSNQAVVSALNPLDPLGPPITDDSDDPDDVTDVDPDNDGSPDDVTTTDLRQPLLDITKTDTYVDTNANGIIDAGDTINYVFDVTNTGNVDLTGISVTDALVTVIPATTIDLVAGANDATTYTASYVITPADIAAGTFSNTAVATAPNPLGGPDISDDSDDPDNPTDVDPDNDGSPDDPTVTDLRQPLLDITKTDTYVDTNVNGIIDAGDTINYTFIVTNTGTVDLTGISVTDALVAVTPATTIDLVAGAIDNSTYTASYVITPADVTAGTFSNQAVVSALNPLDPLGPPITDDSDDPDDLTNVDPNNDGSPDDVTTTDLRQPLLDITKTDTYVDTNANGIIDAGDTINYVFNVTNTGNVDLTGISVTDALVTVIPATTIDLVIGANDATTYTASYVITPADITAGSFTNTAVATAPNPLGGPDITDDSDDSDDPTDIDPDNDGSPDDPTVTDLRQPLLDITKTDTYVDTNVNGIIDAGDTINYTFIVTNTGTVDLTGISVTDALVAVTPATTIDLIAGAVDNSTYTATYTITAADVTAGTFSNQAVVSALNPLDPLGPPITDDSDDPDDVTDVDPDNDGSPDDVTTTDLRQPLLDITKTDTYVDTNANGIIDAGDTINYVFNVTNTGNVDLTGISVTDALVTVIPATTIDLVAGANDNTTYTASYVITPADITAGTFSNTAVATAPNPLGGPDISDDSDDPDNPTDVDPDNDGSPDDPTVTDLRQPLLDITKTDTYVDTNVNGIIDAGDTINYTFIVTNTGTVDLTGISVTDALVAVTPATTIDLIAGAVDNSTYTATYTITAADVTAGSFSNQAVVSALNPLDPLGPPITDDSDDPDDVTDVDPDNDGSPDDVTTTDLRQPLLDITKTDTYVDTNANGIIDAGDTINYVFNVTNTGNVDLTGISVTDALVTVIPATTIDLVAGANDATTYTASYVITPADITAGTFSNTAVADAVNPLGGPNVTDDSDDPDDTTDIDPDNDGSPDDPTVTDLRQPLLDITKTDTYVDTNTNGIIDAGDTINYAFDVTNRGNVDLTGISVTDALVSVTPATTIDLVAGANDATTYTATYTITAADVTAGTFSNQAVVSALNPLNPLGPPITDDSDDPDDLTDNDPDGDGSPDDVTTTDLRQPLLDITKQDTYVDTNGNGIIDAGDTINYVFNVTNTGNVDLTGISVIDALVTVVPATTIDLVAGANDATTYTASYVITPADIAAGTFSNTAVADAVNPLGGPNVTDDSDDPDNPTDIDPNNDGSPDDPTVTDLSQPLLDITKTATLDDVNMNGFADAGESINYVFVVTNRGNVDLTGISVTDGDATVSPMTTIDLVAGAIDNTTYTATHILTQAEIDSGSFTNQATVSGLDPNNVTVTDLSDDPIDITDSDPNMDGSPDDPTVLTLTPNPAISITKADNAPADGSYDTVGEAITYTILVTNDGNVTLTDVDVTDGNADTITPGTITSIDPGQTISVTATHTITQFDLDNGEVINTANVTGDSPTGIDDVTDDSDDPDTPAPDDATITTIDQTPELTLTKFADPAADGAYDTVGEIITYQLEVINTGNVTLTNVAVADANADAGSILPAVVGTLAPGDSVAVTAEHTITQADLDAGIVINRADVVGDAPDGTMVMDMSDDPTTPDPDDATETNTGLITEGRLAVTKSADPRVFAAAGDIITYTIEIENTGTVTLNNITVVDDNATIISGLPITSLAPGGTATVIAEHVVTPTDVLAGQVVNVAEVTGTTPSGETVSETSDDPNNPDDVDPDADGDPDDPTVSAIDSDGDGIADPDDLDDDNDGILDDEEQNGDPNLDTDGDGVVDRLDLDADGDGVLDVYESGADLTGLTVSGEGTIEGDVGADGVPDGVQNTGDFDTGIVNYSTQDTDGDGIDDFQDIDDDNDGILTVDENPDPNGDGNPDDAFDTDGNGTPDYLEPNVTTDGEDGITVFSGMSPNGDGVNDVFVISGIERLENTLEIYNRWGVKVYEANGYGRDNKFFRGISTGRSTVEEKDELPVGTYYYVLEYVLESGERKSRAGYLYINR